MPRTVDFEIDGKVWSMPVTFEASSEIETKVGDPYRLLLATGNREQPISHSEGIGVLYVGCKLAGCKLSRKEIGRLIIEEVGFATSRVFNTICEYLASLNYGPPVAEDPDDQKKTRDP